MNRKIEESFYPLTPGYCEKLRNLNLTAAEWRIWTYLIGIDSWGQNYQDFDVLTVITECNCSKATFYRAISKFQETGLFDFQDKGFMVKNQLGISQLKSS
jgi:hypothetical protein